MQSPMQVHDDGKRLGRPPVARAPHALCLRCCKALTANSDVKKFASKEYFEAHKLQRLSYHSKYHEANKDKRIAMIH